MSWATPDLAKTFGRRSSGCFDPIARRKRRCFVWPAPFFAFSREKAEQRQKIMEGGKQAGGTQT